MYVHVYLCMLYSACIPWDDNVVLTLLFLTESREVSFVCLHVVFFMCMWNYDPVVHI